MSQENVERKGLAPTPGGSEDKKRPLWQRVTAAAFLPFGFFAGIFGRGPSEGIEPLPHPIVNAAPFDLAGNATESGSVLAETFNERHRQKRVLKMASGLRPEYGIRPPEPSRPRRSSSDIPPPSAVDQIRHAYEYLSRTPGDRSSASDPPGWRESHFVNAFVAEHASSDLAYTEEFIAQDEHVIATLVRRVRLPDSDPPVEILFLKTHLWTVREGRIIDVREYPGMEDALKAAGLRDRRAGI